jgi:hypothetical protein
MHHQTAAKGSRKNYFAFWRSRLASGPWSLQQNAK